MNAADLTPDALATLEAKLLADLEMVRRVRALLEEHQGRAAPAPVVPAVPVVAVPARSEPAAPGRPREEVLKECLAATAGRPFAPEGFRLQVKKQTGQRPGDTEIKTFLTRMLRQGSVVVHEMRKGRSGSLYRSLLPVPPPAAESDPASPETPAGAEGTPS
jgi:hypothetical protein